MIWKVFPTDQELGDAAAQEIAGVVRHKPDALVCLAAGHSSLCVFDRLIAMQNSGEADFSKMRVVGLDEWSGMAREHDGSCAGFLWKNLFSHLPLREENVVLFNGMYVDGAAECARIESYIRECGGIDYLLLGIGMNGHLALNEPGTDFQVGAHVTEISETTKTVGQKYFQKPTALSGGITLGIRNILAARRIVLVINGERKQEVTSELFHTAVNPRFPASALKLVPEAEVLVDQAAAQRIEAAELERVTQ